jgi:hypothetical protein
LAVFLLLLFVLPSAVTVVVAVVAGVKRMSTVMPLPPVKAPNSDPCMMRVMRDVR